MKLHCPYMEKIYEVALTHLYFQMYNLSLFWMHIFQVTDLQTQLSYFKKVEKKLRNELGDGKAYTLLSKAVCLISIGANDYFGPFTTNFTLFRSHSHEEYVEMVIGNVTNVIIVLLFTVLDIFPVICYSYLHLHFICQEIYSKGGRKHKLSTTLNGLAPNQATTTSLQRAIVKS